MVGFGRTGVADVSLRYSKDHEATKRRIAGILDTEFASASCSYMTGVLREKLSPAEARLWQERDASERAELHGQTVRQQAPLPGYQPLRICKKDQKLATCHAICLTCKIAIALTKRRCHWFFQLLSSRLCFYCAVIPTKVYADI